MTAGDDQALTELDALLPQVATADEAWAQAQLAQVRRRVAAGQPVDRLLAKVRARLQRGLAQVRTRSEQNLHIAYPADLPVSEVVNEVAAELGRQQVLVFTGETGSGKTTQLPKVLWQAGYGRRGLIGVTQPRRVAAMSVAARLRDELEAAVPQVVHSVRFDDRSDEGTLIRVLTDGLLLAEAAKDKLLSRYEALIIDEAHERSLNIDVLLGLTRQLLQSRPDFRVIVTSASIDAERFAAYFSDAPVISVGGRTWPVDVSYQPGADDDLAYLPACVEAVRNVHESAEPGDVLAFLPTERDILEARRRLDDLRGASVLPLFGRLNAQEQQRIFKSARGRKIVLATNIAETSLTVPGIRYVVDAGLARVKRYSATSRTERLPIEAVAQASALQRAGRAGRTGPGVCIRLYSEEDLTARPAYTQPEILRSNLAGVLLLLQSMGIEDAEHFPWLEAPAAGAWAQARRLLIELGALEGTTKGAWRLTRTGRQLARLSCDPQVGSMLLAGVVNGVAHEVCTLAAFLSVQDPRLRPADDAAKADAAQQLFLHEAGDLATVLQLWDGYRACSSQAAVRRFAQRHVLAFRRLREWADVRHQLWQQLKDLLGAESLPAQPHATESRPLDAIHRSILAGALGNIARWDAEERCYRGAGNRQWHLHPGSALLKRGDTGGKRKARPAWLLACELVETSRPFLRLCAPIDPEWVIAILGPRLERRHRDPHFDPECGRVVCLESISWKGLALREARRVAYAGIDADAAMRLFIREALVADRLKRPPAFVKHNRKLRQGLERLGDRLRDHGLGITDADIEARYCRAFGLTDHERVGREQCIADQRRLQSWLKQHGDDGLRFAEADFMPAAEWERAEVEFPRQVQLDGRRLPVRYVYRPDDPADGATISCRLESLQSLQRDDGSRLIPGLVRHRCDALLRSLPKEQRRRLIPLAQEVASCVAAIADRSGDIETAVRRWVSDRLACREQDIRFGSLPDWVRPRFRLLDAEGQEIGVSRDLTVLAAQGNVVADPLIADRQGFASQPDTVWPGDLPDVLSVGGRQRFPALLRSRDAQARVAVQRTLFAHRRAAATWHADGLMALLEANMDAELSAFAADSRGGDAGIEAQLGLSAGAVRRQLGLLALGDGLPMDCRDAEAFGAWLATRQEIWSAARLSIDRLLTDLVTVTKNINSCLRRGVTGMQALQVTGEAREDLGRLLAPGWPTRLSWAGVQRLPLYLQLVADRLRRGRALPQAQIQLRQRLLGDWRDLADPRERAYVMAAGYGLELRRATDGLEECLLQQGDADLATQGGGPTTRVQEGEVRQSLWNIGKGLQALQKEDRRLRDLLLDLRPYLERAPAGARRDGLCKRVDLMLRDFPDCYLGADLQQQHVLVEDLLQELRAVIG